MARVVVIGGGYGGVTVAKGLDPIADVVLVERKDQFVHHAAAMRAAVDSVWQEAIFMPYSYLLTNGEVVHATVSKVVGNTVYLYGQDPIEADYLVIATGSTYPFPAKHITSQSAVSKQRLDDTRESLKQAGRVLLVGGGTVGLEMAGELVAEFPDLEVVIVEKEDRILPYSGYTDEFRSLVQEQAEELGIEVIAGAPLAFLPPNPLGTLGRFQVVTTAGNTVEADMWFQCFGTEPATGYLRNTDYAEALNQDGSIKVLPTLQVVGHPNTYAIGDVTDVAESKRADAARSHARVVVANIASQINGEEPDSVYQIRRDWIVLSMGPSHGASQLVDDLGQTKILGADQTAEIKGTDLMVSVQRSQMSLP
ncbi:FAD-dependent oxidoreductase [Actinomycetaceae bacterium MB13-C1-2]|nr:FAD-dependent oxidoreductase [Actinomycetaceae bacterium MB13-C1-2]